MFTVFKFSSLNERKTEQFDKEKATFEDHLKRETCLNSAFNRRKQKKKKRPTMLK